MKNLRLLTLLLLFSSIALFPTIFVSAQSSDAGTTCETTTAYADFLSDRYDLSFNGEVAQADFTAALVTLAGEVEAPAELDFDGFTGLEALLTSLYYVNLDELAFTYSEDKADAALGGVTVDFDLTPERRQELAAAFDTGLYDPACASAFDLSAPLDSPFADYLLGRVLELTGQYKNYVGYVTDPDIYGRLIYAWNSFDQVLDPELQAPAVDLIREGIITGYNLKRTTLDADFDPDLSIIYGHADIAHARQLIGLLRSEDLNARVLLEPKTSAFLYLAEWGEPSPSPSFQVEALDDGNYIAYAKEFDLAFEFGSVEDRDRFDSIILAYAKKDADDEPGLILGSWWQPLYSSRVPLSEYIAVTNNVVQIGDFYLQSFSLTESSDAIISSFEEAYPEGRVETWDLWVNVAFHNYLLGEPT